MKLDISRMSKGLLTAEFAMFGLTPEEDGVDYEHYRIMVWPKGADNPWFLSTCEDGILKYMTEAEMFQDYDAIIEWQKIGDYTNGT